MQRHGASLKRVNLINIMGPDGMGRWRFLNISFYNSMSQQLRVLRLNGHFLVDERLSALTSLTSLCFIDCHILAGVQTALLALPQLRSLEVPGTRLLDQDGGSLSYGYDTGFLTSLSTSLVQLTRLNLYQALWVHNDNHGALRALPCLCEVEAGGRYPIAATRLSREFTGLPLTSISIAVRDQRELGELKAWLLQTAPGSQLSPLSCLRELDLRWLQVPTASLGMESWASRLVQLTELRIRGNPVEEVRQAFGARFLHQRVVFAAFVLRPLEGP